MNTLETAANITTREITPENAVFRETDGGFVSLSFGGESYDRFRASRCFPFTAPDEYISIRKADEKAEEIGMIRRLSDFPPDVAALLKKQLDLHYFTPVITKILSARDEYGYGYFHVQTNQGELRFITRMDSSAFIFLSDKRVLVVDIDGNRFEIPDMTALGRQEQRKLELFF
ncbi:MAG: DUF1854 domain-containing protein [Oscillospiraceae bacterium]|jgi:hypothetical protein|nr:DUF1854 domain-containing protein [Oscillospiraceae bacterium]